MSWLPETRLRQQVRVLTLLLSALALNPAEPNAKRMRI